MKFSATLLALCAIHGASAFVAQPQSARPSVSLASSRGPGRPETRTGERTASGVNRRVGGGALDKSGDRRVDEQRSTGGGRRRRSDDWEFTPTIVQGGSLETWSFPSPAVERVQVILKTEGRPLNANVELWQGPDNTPQKMGVYLEDGSIRPFNAIIATPRGSNAIAIRNTGHLEFPLTAGVEEMRPNSGIWSFDNLPKTSRTVQGGAVYTEPFAPGVESVQIMLRTDGRPLNARIELLQGPNNNKQVIELYTEDGYERPFLAVIETPEVGNVIRIVNTATVEFPLTASMEPLQVDSTYDPNYSVGRSTGGGAVYTQGRPVF